MKIRGTRQAFIALTVLAVSACGQTVSGAPGAAEIDVRKLDVGKYPTAPLDDYYSPAYSVRRGNSLAATRLSDHVVIGNDIDPKLRYGTSIQEVNEPDDVTQSMAAPSKAVAERNKMQFGFVSGSSDFRPVAFEQVPPTATLVTVTVLQFPSMDAAATAAREFEAVDFDVNPAENQRVPIGKFPAAHAHWRPGTPTIGSTIAHGHYTVSAFVSTSSPDLALLTSLVEKTYAAQLPKLDALPPLSPEQVLRSELDPEGMKRRVLNPIKLGVPSVGGLATNTLQGFLHFQTDREEAKRFYSVGNIEYVTMGQAYSANTYSYNSEGIAQSFGTGASLLLDGAMVFRSRDEESAKALWGALAAEPDPAMAPPGVPDSKCAEEPKPYSTTKYFLCIVRYRNYVGHVWSTQIQDSQQRAAAQYAVLANSQ
ncbi:DUF7373 family lipoprotein [Nocardia coubleae]|uniref:Uncharacterized protein n=1 Tax=Nocardia coubleae TaxID=356147 RepID=A0A846WCK8_9NOCA|nr:hypothetical protein [Nocardia coubleae]NKX90513.1 hypothetical protein [Nocardia coubleae]